jgi:hypothetical protein
MERKRVIAILLGLVLFSAGFIFQTFAQAEEGRSLWVWNRGNVVKNIVTAKEDRDDFFAFVKTPHGIGTPFTAFYLDAKRVLGEEKDKLADFIKEAHKNKIKVYYLDGDPTWAVAYQMEALSRVNAVVDYNKAKDAAKFDGIIFDIEPYLLITTELGEEEKSLTGLEPYLLPQWKTQRLEVEKKYLALIEQIINELKQSDSDLEFGVAMPLLFTDKAKNEQKSLSDRVLDLVDFAVLMDYRDVSIRVIRDGKPAVDYATRAGKKLIIAVETLDLVSVGEGGNADTFAEEGHAYLEQELKKVREVFKGLAGYGGTSIHYYNSYKNLQEQDTNKVIADVPVIEAARVITPIKLDGYLDEWEDKATGLYVEDKENIVYKAMRRWAGPEDLSAIIFAQWDPENIYLAAKVKDNNIVVSKENIGRGMWADDHIEVWLGPEQGVDTGIIRDYQVGFSPGDKNIKAFAVSWVPEYLTDEMAENIKVASRPMQGGGYVIEAKIPTNIIDNLRPEKGKMIRFSLDISDTDSKTVKQEILMSPTERVWGKSGTFAKLAFE